MDVRQLHAKFPLRKPSRQGKPGAASTVQKEWPAAGKAADEFARNWRGTMPADRHVRDLVLRIELRVHSQSLENGRESGTLRALHKQKSARDG
jgi:hypothetical protein